MTIIHFTGMRSNKYGGLEKFFVELASQLTEKNYDLVLVYEEMPTSEQYIEQLKAYKVKIEILNTKNNAISKSLISVVKLLNKYKPEVIHTHFDPAAYIVLLVSALLRYKVRIKNMHGMLYTGIEKINVGSVKELPLKTRFLKQLMYRLSTHIFSVSDAIKKQFVEIFDINEDKKIECLYLGVPQNFTGDVAKIKEELGIEDNILVISCVAFHDRVKGIDVLLKAVGLLKSRNENITFKLLLIGGGKSENTNELRNLVTNLGIKEHVIWLGVRSDVGNIMAISDIYVQPSRSEGISLSLMEAAMNGIPMIATNTGGIPEIVKHNKTGFLVEVDDFEAMSYFLEELLKSTTKRKEIGDNAKNLAKDQFQITCQVEKLIRKYEQFVKI